MQYELVQLLRAVTPKIYVKNILIWKKRPVYTKNDNMNKDNYKDNDIGIHTSRRYRLFILSTLSSRRFQFLSSLKQDGFWLGVNVCIVHPTMLFIFAFIIIAVDSVII